MVQKYLLYLYKVSYGGCCAAYDVGRHSDPQGGSRLRPQPLRQQQKQGARPPRERPPGLHFACFTRAKVEILMVVGDGTQPLIAFLSANDEELQVLATFLALLVQKYK